MKYIIGIDLGGMSAKGGLFSEDGELIVEEKVATCSEDGFEGTLQKLSNLSRALVEKIGANYADVLSIGVGSPGVVDSKEGNVLRWSNYEWNNVPFAKTLSRLTGKKVYVANDANVAALGEVKFGATAQYQSSVLLTIGTGIGGGISNEGEILFEPLRRAVDARTYIAMDIVPLKIVGAKLGNRAGIYGAYSIAKNNP